MTYSDTHTQTRTQTLYRPPGLERLYEMIDSCERHAVEVARDFAEDPDFSKIARGVNALVQMQALIAKRVEADRDRRQREEGAAHTNIHTMKPFDAESLAKLHGDAKRLREVESAKSGANDNSIVPGPVPGPASQGSKGQGQTRAAPAQGRRQGKEKLSSQTRGPNTERPHIREMGLSPIIPISGLGAPRRGRRGE